MSNQDDVEGKIEQQNQTIENYFSILQDVEEGEKVSVKALSVYQLQGSGFVQSNNGKVKGVMRSNDKMIVDKYNPVNETIDSLEEETVIQLEDRTIVGVDQQAAAKIGNIVNQAMQHRATKQNQKKQGQVGFDTDKDLGYIG